MTTVNNNTLFRYWHLYLYTNIDTDFDQSYISIDFSDKNLKSAQTQYMYMNRVEEDVFV